MKSKILKINELSQFITVINKFNDQHLFYRGQNKVGYNLLPSVLRSPEYFENESYLFNEFLTQAPELFRLCTTNFDRLALMQHHQLPTRLLDVTLNPLIALYFACFDYKCGKDSEDGVVYIFSDKAINKISNPQSTSECVLDIYENQLHTNNFNKSPYSDEIELKSCLVRVSREDQKNILKEVKIFLEHICKSKYEMLKWFEEFTKWKANNKSSNTKMPKLLWKYYKKLEGYGCYSVQQLFHEAKKDVNNFRVMMDPVELITPRFVHSRLIDNRIKNQRGAFIFSPFSLEPSDFEKTCNEVEESIKTLLYNGTSDEPNKILISKESKKKILKELDQVGINSSFIYPDDYSKIANQISEQI